MDPSGRTRYSPYQKRNKRKQESTKPSVNHLKKRRRNLQRLLGHSESLPADVRLAHERELASCNHDIESAEKAAKKSQMISKYHKARFFERKKATRALNKAKKNLAEANSTADRSLLEAEVHRREVDLNYTQFYPLDMDYISLYAGKKDPNESVNRSSPIWKVVETEMANGRLNALREGKLRRHLVTEETEQAGDAEQTKALSKGSRKHVETTSESISAPQRKKVQEPGRTPAELEHSDSDQDGGGFFE